MAELLLNAHKRNAVMCVSRFSVKDICAIVSDMSVVADKHNNQTVQSESILLNEQLQSMLCSISDKDRSAFEQFYDRTIKLCFSQALRITRKTDIAEEVVSDVYLQVWNRAASYDDQRSGVMTWLMMLCRSRALDALRRHKNQQTKESVDIDAIAEPFVDEDPQDILNALQQGSFLHSAIQQLKPHQRQLLSLAYFKGLTHNEISRFTDLPLGTVKTQIRRSIIMLKELMNDPVLYTDDKNCGGSDA
jgi:RNA polymerase sigma-70 factor (ECF subfamily)